jgi:hypothetical protein
MRKSVSGCVTCVFPASRRAGPALGVVRREGRGCPVVRSYIDRVKPKLLQVVFDNTILTARKTRLHDNTNSSKLLLSVFCLFSHNGLLLRTGLAV